MDADPFAQKMARHRPGGTCTVRKIVDQLDDERRQLLDRHLKSDWRAWDGTSHSAIAAVLQDWGFHVRALTVGRHRRGIRGHPNGCACDE